MQHHWIVAISRRKGIRQGGQRETKIDAGSLVDIPGLPILHLVAGPVLEIIEKARLIHTGMLASSEVEFVTHIVYLCALLFFSLRTP